MRTGWQVRGLVVVFGVVVLTGVAPGCGSSGGEPGGGLGQKENCSDGQQNGGETDVDCGGSCLPCQTQKNCRNPTDCQTGNCQSIFEGGVGGQCAAQGLFLHSDGFRHFAFNNVAQKTFTQATAFFSCGLFVEANKASGSVGSCTQDNAICPGGVYTASAGFIYCWHFGPELFAEGTVSRDKKAVSVWY